MTKLRIAQNALRESGDKRTSIGLIKSDCQGLSLIRKGTIVLFRKYENGQFCTIELAMTPEQIAEQKAKGSGLVAIGTMVNVPIGYVKKIQ